MRWTTPLLLAFGLCWAGVARAQTPPGEPVDPDDEGYFDDLPELPPAPDPAAAPAPQQWRYNGPHAINADAGGGWCDVRTAHYHPYPPFDELLFQEDDGGYDFVGDPTDFGYAGSDLYWYEGDHPMAAGWGAGWCFMTWPHRHFYRPGSGYVACGSRWCYRGPRDHGYWGQRTVWGPIWARYPSHYWGRTYFRSRLALRPGHWAGVRWRSGYGAGPTIRHGRALVAPHTAGRAMGRSIRSATPPIALPRASGSFGRPLTMPRGRPARIEPRSAPRMVAPSRSWSAARVAPAPRPTYPTRSWSTPRMPSPSWRSPGPARAFAAPRPSAPTRTFAAPRPSAPTRTFAAPRPSAPSHAAPAPRPSSSHGSSGGSSHGGRHR